MKDIKIYRGGLKMCGIQIGISCRRVLVEDLCLVDFNIMKNKERKRRENLFYGLCRKLKCADSRKGDYLPPSHTS